MIVKRAFNTPASLSIYSMLTVFFWGIGSIFTFMLEEDEIIRALVCLSGLPVFIFSIIKDHKRQGIKARDYIEEAKMKLKLQCPQCKNKMGSAIEHDDVEGLPILYECKACDVLWFAGDYVKSA